MHKYIFSYILAGLFLCFTQCTTSTKQIDKEAEQSPKVKNVILMIGDGMGVSQVYAGLTASKGMFAIERSHFTGFSKTHSANNYITDSAAGATAIACGVKTNNGTIGLDSEGNHAKSLLEYANENGMATGIVVTCEITNATPASFIAHQKHRSMNEEIAADFLKTDINVFIGGGRTYFEDRSDKQNLTNHLKTKGYKIAYTLEDVKNTTEGKLSGLLSEKHLPPYKERGNMLPDAVQTAINLLEKNDNGFFLMVEGSQIDFECHANNGEGAIDEMLDFDRAIKVAFDFADKNPGTLVVITADHETGGVALTSGDIDNGEVGLSFSTKRHTAVMVPVFAYGVQAQNFSGIYENTSFLPKILKELGIL